MERILDIDPERVVAKAREPYAVIDIGSNSVRLVVYNELGRAPFPRFNEKSLCRLGASIDDQGHLSGDAMEMALRAICRFSEIATAMGVAQVDVLATEAVRRAANGGDFVDLIRKRSGLEARVLSGKEEAYYTAYGVISGFYRPKGLVGDLGGGSLEVAEVIDDAFSEDRLVSMPLGALPVLALMSASPSEAKKHVDDALANSLPPLLTEPVFYAVGGGWRAIARAHMARAQYPVRVTHGYEIAAEEARSFARLLRQSPPEELAAMQGIPGRRVTTVPAAALVLERVLKRLKPERVVFSALGLREGWLYAQLPREEQYRDPLIEGAQAFALEQARVPAFARALVRWTDDLFPGEAAPEKRLRLAACALSDIAWRDHADVQAHQSFHRLIQFPFIGLDHGERVFVAAVVHARYGGKAEDTGVQEALVTLPEAHRRRAQVLGKALLLGYRFAASVPEILDSAQIKIETGMVRLVVRGSEESVPDSEAVRARLKLFAKAVGVPRAEITNGA